MGVKIAAPCDFHDKEGTLLVAKTCSEPSNARILHLPKNGNLAPNAGLIAKSPHQLSGDLFHGIGWPSVGALARNDNLSLFHRAE